MKSKLLLLVVGVLLSFFSSFSQTTGIIVRPAGSNGPVVLDPNSDGYTSSSSSGFGTNDMANSEIPYKVVPPVIPEPTGDLYRGPSGSFSDIVRTYDGSGYYLYNDGTNLLCRLRIGGIVSGNKGYSLLLDTDGKFGNTGTQADPNYLPATNASNGNPGFELEIVFETNSRVAVYNVDGSNTAALITSYPVSTNSQISIAATTDSGNPDYFYDFYVPFSALGISSSTPLRSVTTTVMAPLSAIGGPKSDIYGLSGNNYMNDWTTVITSQPSFTLDSLKSGGSGVGPTCTAAPVLNSPITPSTTLVTGTWTKTTNSSITTATITLYKGTTSIGTTSVNTGGTWTISVSGLVNADIITAKAQGVGESVCMASNTVIVSACNSSNIPTTPTLTCTSGSKGITGTNLATGWTVHVDNLTRSTTDNNISNSSALFGTNTGTTPNITWLYSGGCSTGAPLTSGSYKIYYTDNSTGCSSAPAYFCAAGNGPNALAGTLGAPVITSPSSGIFTPATSTISGTSSANANLDLYFNGINTASVTASATGVFSFTGLNLTTGQQFYIIDELSSGTVGTSYCAAKTLPYTVTCFTSAPVISVGSTNQLVTGAPITGTSADAAGTIIRVYTSAAVLVATTTVQADGTWSTGNTGTTPAVYNAVTATTYYANAQNGSCGLSANSSTFASASATGSARCGSLPATVSENATSVSGTLSGTALAGTLVTLYEDGIAIGTYTTSNSSWGPIAVNTTSNNIIYTGGILSIGITEPSKTEVICGATVTVSCVLPAAPVITPVVASIAMNQSVTYTISSTQSGILYSIDNTSGNTSLGTSTFGSGSSENIITNTYPNTGTYYVSVTATSFSGAGCVSTTPATIYVTGTLPVQLLKFEGRYGDEAAHLHWITSSEIRVDSFELQKSFSGSDFIREGAVKAIGGSQISQNYYYNDSVLATGMLYYRLKLITIDKNNEQYSNIIALHTDKGISLTGISPNPFSESIHLTFNSLKEIPVSIVVNDMDGKKVRNINFDAHRGINHVDIPGLSDLVKGTYLLQLKTGGQTIVKQLLIKQ